MAAHFKLCSMTDKNSNVTEWDTCICTARSIVAFHLACFLDLNLFSQKSAPSNCLKVFVAI